MKKSIKLLICILIAIIVIPINSFAAVTPSKDNTDSEIVKYWKEKSGDLSSVDKGILKSWRTTLTDYLEKRGPANTGDEIEIDIIDGIDEEIESRKPTESEITKYWKENGDFSNLDSETVEEWYGVMVKYFSARGYYATEDERNAFLELTKEAQSRTLIGTTAEFIEYWKPTTGSNTELKSMADKILGIIQIFGSVVAVIVLVIIGIKYMLGSVSEKAKYKETMLPYIVGCIMLFGITNIASIIYKFAQNL